MTVDEAIMAMEHYKLHFALTRKAIEAFDMAIEALEQEPCTDAISRQAVLDLIEHYNSDGLGSVFYGYEQGVKFADAVNELPPVIPAEKVGRWKRISMDKYSEHAKYWYRCDRCGKDNLGNTNYCPHCGAKMQEVEE